MKKFATMAISIALIGTMVAGGSLAYLQDTDSDVNVMTLGNVKIEQFEKERVFDANGNVTGMQDFTQGQALLPAVVTNGSGNEAWAPNSGVDINYGDYIDGAVGGNGTWQNLNNVMDKFVFVKNTGKTDAYYRTIIAYEAETTVEMVNSYNQDMIHFNINGNNRFVWDETVIEDVEIKGVKYNVFSALYTDVLKPGEISRPSLLQVGMDQIATNEYFAQFGDTYDILVLSQAVQAAGFDDAKTALNTAFGELTRDNIKTWFDDEEVEVPVVVNASSDEALAKAINDNKNVVVKLADGEYATNFKVDGGKDVTIIGEGEDTVISGQIATTSSTEGTVTLKNVTVKVDSSIKDSTGISQTGKSAIAIWGNQTVICENVTFDMSLDNSTAITSWWDTGVGTSIIVKDCTFNCNGQRPIRATGNVTVENCTFNDPYRYAVQLTAKASTATELDKAIINFNNNTIVNGENGKDFVYGIQLEGADYGCNNCVINGAGNKIENGGTASTMYYCECGKVDHDTITWNVEVEPVHEK